MSTDEAVTKDLIETLEDGAEGFAKAAEKLAESDDPTLAETFRRYSDQRASFSSELRELAKDYGDNIEESGSAAGTLHRGWITLKDALTGSSPHAVLEAAETGENHAVKEYEKALDADISPTLHAVVARQGAEVTAAHDKIRSLADANR